MGSREGFPSSGGVGGAAEKKETVREGEAWDMGDREETRWR